uniref:Uncharacterized protein n=1 Tax=Clytia hemisphaerica TaxID=252671 RepID=A0A7M5X0V6_9CNID
LIRDPAESYFLNINYNLFGRFTKYISLRNLTSRTPHVTASNLHQIRSNQQKQTPKMSSSFSYKSFSSLSSSIVNKTKPSSASSNGSNGKLNYSKMKPVLSSNTMTIYTSSNKSSRGSCLSGK